MHVALTNQDLIAVIVADLPKDTLAVLGQTCKAFSDIALNALWRVMNSLDPLYLCLPADVCVRDADGELVRGKLTSEPSHWERFDVNAARIKVLVYSSRSKIRQDLLLMLKLCRQQQSPPLPNLSELKVQCTCSEGELAILLSTLMHCHLQSLMVNSPYTNAVAAVLSAAQLSSPSLQALSIRRTPNVLPLASGFTQLRVLTYFVAKSVIDSLSLTLLSRLTHLHTLDITAKLTTTSFNPDTQSNTSITTCFPALERLSLHGVLDLQTLSRFLRLITSPGLQHITIIYQQSRVLQTDMSALGKGLAAHTRLSSLNLSNLSSTSEKICVSDLSTHLCHLQNLEMVKLHSVLSDVEISKHLAIPQLTSTWSKLRRLSIVCDSWACAPELEFLLRHFASNCPLLEYLYIAASVSVSTNFAAMNDLPPSPRISRTLKICLAPRGKHEFVFDKTAAFKVAVYISDIYPNIEIAPQSSLFTSVDTGTRAAWQEVSDWIHKLNAVRAAERERTRREMLLDS